jgi:hypothetical protein
VRSALLPNTPIDRQQIELAFYFVNAEVLIVGTDEV